MDARLGQIVPLATAVAPHSLPAEQRPLFQRKHIPMATEVPCLLLCVHPWFMIDGSWVIVETDPWDTSHQLLGLLVFPPFEQLHQKSPSKG